MRIANLTTIVAIVFFIAGFASAAQESHDHMKGMETPTKQTRCPRNRLSSRLKALASKLFPQKRAKSSRAIRAARVQTDQGQDRRACSCIRRRRDGGYVQGSKGTLNGVKPGQHTLELRVTTGDHNTELNATDKVTFTTK